MAASLLGMVASCSSPLEGPAIGGPPSSRGTGEQAQTQGSALIGGYPNPSVNASQGLISGSTSEQETAAVTLDSPAGTTQGHAVAFNILDTAHMDVHLTEYCPRYSASAFSYTLNSSPFLTNAKFTGMQIPTPPGISMLVGDPAVGVYDSGSSWTFYVASLAVSDDTWKKNADETGCIPTGNVGEGRNIVLLDKVCVNAVSIPKSGGAPTPLPNKSWCAFAISSNGVNNYDGTKLFVDFYTEDVYVAAWNIKFGGKTVDVFKNSTQLPNPFPAGGITNHPLFVTPSPDDTPTLIGRSFTGFYVATFDGSSWTTSLITPNKLGGGTVTLANGTQLAQIGYAAALGENNDGKHMFFFYTTLDTPARIQGVKCGFYPTVTCTTLPASITPAGSNAYSPAVAYVNHFPGGVFNVPWLSYWTDATTPTGNLQMIMSKVNLTDGSLTPYTITGVNETPCPQGSYWGDYDALTVGNNGGGFGQLPFLLRYLTDSTASTCNPATGMPQHVSVTLGDPNL